jgi:solute carrier family 36 (proton-coupled amino acid transporter)
MASEQPTTEPSLPRPISGAASNDDASPSLPPGSVSRATATAKLASSPQILAHPSPATVAQDPSGSQLNADTLAPLPGPSSSSDPRSGRSALAAAFDEASRRSPNRLGSPAARALSPSNEGIIHAPKPLLPGEVQDEPVDPSVGSPTPSTVPYEDPDVVNRHLVRPSHEDIGSFGKKAVTFQSHSPQPGHRPSINPDAAPDLDEFSSLQLEGGDVHRQVYRWAEEASLARVNPRSHSFTAIRPHPEDEELNIQNIKVPGGFRRNFLRRSAGDSTRTSIYGTITDQQDGQPSQPRHQPVIATNSFIEFLTIYGHFAGEELEEEDDESDSYFSGDYHEGGEGDQEDSALLTPRTPGGRKRPKRPRAGKGRSTPMDATLLLLKSFVGTGVLFLPKAFLNGGLLFSSLVLVGVAALSYWCFILLVTTRLKVEGSFGDMGGMIYGRVMRGMILTSIVLSQFGFVSAYIVFISENLQAFISAVSQCRTWIDIKWMVLMQLIIFLPLSLVRDISKLGFTALVADVFILLGLVYLYYFDISSIATNGLSDVVNFNPITWPGFIGTAIFTFEGIGLIIPIQESMRNPAKFPPVLGIVMIIITVIFTSMGALSYGAFGSKTKTVVILNLPQDSKFVNGVQFLYSLAILLSTPLQLFPAIRILETELFTRSGKNNPYVKWKKNVFRFFLVMVCALVAWGGASDLDKFVSIVGSFACVPLVYVYPVSLPFSRANAL